jgi:hypothetical protein
METLSFLRKDKLHKKVTAEEFLKVVKTQKHSIKKTRFVAPTLGTFELGSFEIEFEYDPKH